MKIIDHKIAIIPARGGSKRLPRKNIVEIFGRPVLDYTIKAAIETNLFEHIIVSTEDPEIEETAIRSGAEVWRRPVNLASDTATMDEVIIEVLAQYDKRYDCKPAMFCCLLATAALRIPDDILNTFLLLEPGICDFALTYKEYESFPHEALNLDKEGHLSPMWPKIMFLKRWQRPKLVKDAGSVYWLFTEAFLEQNTFFGTNLRGYPLPAERAVDLDEPSDLELMKYYMSKKSNG